MLGWLKRSRGPKAGRTGLSLQGDSMALVHLAPQHGRTVVQLAELLDGDPRHLRERVAQLGLGGSPCVLLPDAADYQLLLATRPQVEEAELAQAMRWQIRDQVSQAPESLVVDAWPLPDEAWRGRNPMAYCAVLPRQRMRELAGLVKDAGLELEAIDIGEMALRNLGLLAGSNRALALLQPGEQDSLLTVQLGDELCMARRIGSGLLNRGEASNALALEIRRSLDYFERQFTRGPVSRLLVLPSLLALGELQASLGLPVEELDAPLLHSTAFDALGGHGRAACIPALGAALRQENI